MKPTLTTFRLNKRGHYRVVLARDTATGPAVLHYLGRGQAMKRADEMQAAGLPAEVWRPVDGCSFYVAFNA